MRIFLEPNESLIFRTGRPFDAGEINYAETLFPPTPETLQGAVRALLASAYNSSTTADELFDSSSELVPLIGNRDGYGCFRITNIALARRNHDSMEIELLYPTPAHLVSDEAQNYFRLKPEKQEEIRSNMPAGMHFLLIAGEPVGKINPVEGWLTETDLKTVLSTDGDLSTIKPISPTDVFLHEPRLGIGMDNASKSTRDGMLYSVQMLRMQRAHRFKQPEHEALYTFGFIVDIHLTALNSTANPQANALIPEPLLSDEQTQYTLKLNTGDQGWVVLGGEQRTASYHLLGETLPLPHQTVQSGNKPLLYLATPAVFTNGWQPQYWPGSPPIAAAIPRYQSIGGWKLQPGQSGGENKAMRRCVPAGSVYFFDPDVSSSDVSLSDAHQLSIESRKIGYGITITGEWKE